MKIKVRDVRPNPYRNIEHYPLNKEKIMTLTQSIERTGFWDNLVGRNVNGEIQIAYGHHRIEALRLAKGYGYDFEFELPIKNIDDATMIQIMANENMQEWGHSLAVTDETVKVAKEYLENLHLPGKRKSEMKGRKDYQNQVNAPEIAGFLGWNQHKVHESLKRMNLINQGVISKQAVETFESERKAEYFAGAIVKAEKNNVKFTPQEQEKIAKELVDNDVSRKDIKSYVEAKAFEKKFPKKENNSKKQKEIDLTFTNFYGKIKNQAIDLGYEIKQLSKFAKEFKSADETTIRGRVRTLQSLESLRKDIDVLFEALRD